MGVMTGIFGYGWDKNLKEEEMVKCFKAVSVRHGDYLGIGLTTKYDDLYVGENC